MRWFSKASTHVTNLKNLGQNHYSTEVNIIELWLLQHRQYIICCMHECSLPNGNLNACSKKGTLCCQLAVRGEIYLPSELFGVKRISVVHAIL